MTDARYDRRLIAPLMLPHFPKMADTKEHKFTSDEWHGFMNAVTGLDVPLDMRNANAFDLWRQALAKNKNLPVWTVTPEREAFVKQRGEQLKVQAAQVDEFLRDEKTMARLREEAPGKTAAQVVADYEALVKQIKGSRMT